MAKEIYLYGQINDDSAKQFVMDLEANAESDVVIRINTDGGNPQSMWGMFAKYNEHKGNKLVKVDGRANSSGVFFVSVADDCEALDVSEFAIHRAAYPDWLEKNYMTDELKASLLLVNDGLRKALEKKINVEAFEKIVDSTLDKIFSLDSRITVRLKADQALKVGLINRVIKTNDVDKKAIDDKIFSISGERYFNMAAEHAPEPPKPVKAMTKAEFKAAHPGVYAEIVEEGRVIGADAEFDRISACLVFQEVDPKAVKTAIEARKPMSDAQKMEFMLAAQSPAYLEKLRSASASATTTTEASEGAEKTAEKVKFDKFSADVKKYLGK